jgi:hypothetical protein
VSRPLFTAFGSHSALRRVVPLEVLVGHQLGQLYPGVELLQRRVVRQVHRPQPPQACRTLGRGVAADPIPEAVEEGSAFAGVQLGEGLDTSHGGG